ncbi:hypothetical protein D3C81_1011550 [compost metagenome]
MTANLCLPNAMIFSPSTKRSFLSRKTRKASSCDFFNRFSRFSAFETSCSVFSSCTNCLILSIIRSEAKKLRISSRVANVLDLFSMFFNTRRPICSSEDVRLLICSTICSLRELKALITSSRLSAIFKAKSSNSENLLSSSSS